MELERRYHAAKTLATDDAAPGASVPSPQRSTSHDQHLLHSVDSASSLTSTVYDDDEQQTLHPRPGSAPPNLHFESSAFFNFGGSNAFFSHVYVGSACS